MLIQIIMCIDNPAYQLVREIVLSGPQKNVLSW